MTDRFDSLRARAKILFDQDPLSGHRFLFGNRSRDRIKILFGDQDGFCICYKRLERGGRLSIFGCCRWRTTTGTH